MDNKIYSKRVKIELVTLGILALVYVFLFQQKQQPARATRTPKTAQQYHLLAKTLLDKGSYKKAEEAAHKALAIDGACYKARMDLGCVYTEAGEYIKAEREFVKALEHTGKDRASEEIIYYNLGGLYERERSAEKAWEYFSRAYAARSALSRGSYWEKAALGELRFVIKNDRESFIGKIKAKTDTPREVLGRVTAVRKNIERKKYPMVIDETRRYLQENPGSCYAYLFAEPAVYALINQGKYEQAGEYLRYFDNVPLNKERQAWVWFVRARLAFYQKEYPEAWKSLARMIEVSGDSYTGSSLEDMFEEVIKDAQGELTLQDLDASALPEKYLGPFKYHLGQSNYQNRRYERALEFLESVIAQDDTFKALSNAYNLAADIYVKKQDTGKAKSILLGYLKKFPRGLESELFRMKLVQMYLREGDYLRAYESYRSSRLAVPVQIGEIGMLLLAVAVFLGVFFFFSWVFFRQKIAGYAACGIYRKIDLFFFLALLMGLPTVLYSGLLAGYYYARPFFEGIKLNPILAGVLAGNVVFAGAALFFLKKKYKLTNDELGFFSRGYTYNIVLPIAVLLGTVVVIIVFGVLYERFHVEMPTNVWDDMMKTVIAKEDRLANIWSMFVILTFVVPCCEEITFRVLLYNFFKRYTNVFWGLVLSSLFFTLGHMPFILWPFFFTMGLILGIVYQKTRTIIPCMVCHVLYNLVVFSIGFLFVGGVVSR